MLESTHPHTFLFPLSSSTSPLLFPCSHLTIHTLLSYSHLHPHTKHPHPTTRPTTNHPHIYTHLPTFVFQVPSSFPRLTPYSSHRTVHTVLFTPYCSQLPLPTHSSHPPLTPPLTPSTTSTPSYPHLPIHTSSTYSPCNHSPQPLTLINHETTKTTTKPPQNHLINPNQPLID